MVNATIETLLEKIVFSFARGFQVKIMPWLGVEVFVYFLLSVGAPSGSNMHGPGVCCGSVCEFICPLILLC